MAAPAKQVGTNRSAGHHRSIPGHHRSIQRRALAEGALPPSRRALSLPPLSRSEQNTGWLARMSAKLISAYGWIGHLKSFSGTRVTVTSSTAAAESTAASDVSRYGVTFHVTA